MLNFKYTLTELEIIKQVALGHSNKEISKILFISVSTVKTHLENIYYKSGIKNRVQLAVLAAQKGLIN